MMFGNKNQMRAYKDTDREVQELRRQKNAQAPGIQFEHVEVAKPAQAPMVKGKPIPTVVVDLKTREWGPEPISKPSGLIWRYEGAPAYWMVRNPEGELASVLPPANPKVLPEDLYEALHWLECKVLFKIEPTLLEKLNFWGMFLLIALLLLFAFIFISEMMKGGGI